MRSVCQSLITGTAHFQLQSPSPVLGLRYIYPQKKIEAWRWEYNAERTHSSLVDLTPYELKRADGIDRMNAEPLNWSCAKDGVWS